MRRVRRGGEGRREEEANEEGQYQEPRVIFP